MTPVPETTVGDVPEMVARVARAMCEERIRSELRMTGDVERDDDIAMGVDYGWSEFASTARAAIAAMTEPTDFMSAAGLRVWRDLGDPQTWKGEGPPPTTDKCVGDFLAGNPIRWAKPIYRAILAAALGNTEGAR